MQPISACSAASGTCLKQVGRHRRLQYSLPMARRIILEMSVVWFIMILGMTTKKISF
jgi:hypothetical protein